MAMEETSADSMEKITDTADTTIEVLDIAAAVEILLDVATFWEEMAMEESMQMISEEEDTFIGELDTAS